jgi:hypothetical protein
VSEKQRASEKAEALFLLSIPLRLPGNCLEFQICSRDHWITAFPNLNITAFEGFG